MKRFVLPAVAALAFMAMPASAQISLYGMGGPALTVGDDLDAVENGIQLTGGVQVGINERVAFYAEGQWGTHGVDGSDDVTVNPTGLFAGLGLGFAEAGAALRPFVFGGVGLQGVAFDTESADPSDRTFGYHLGGGVGFDLFGLPSALRGAYQAASFDADSELSELDFSIITIMLAFGFPLGGS